MNQTEASFVIYFQPQKGYRITLKAFEMDNMNQIPDNNLETNLGKALIGWFRMTKGRNQNRYKGSDYSYKNAKSSDTQYTDLLSVKIRYSDPPKKRKRNFYPD